MTKRTAIILAASLLASSSCRNPRVDANIAQAMIDVGNQISAMQQDQSLLQAQVDSLRDVVARQDTVISRLASLAGLPLPPR
jgi:peptidoglycan hydrolase CwlO-like protein